MSLATKKEFLLESDLKVNDLEHKRKISFNIAKYDEAVLNGKKQFAQLEKARKIAKNKKWAAIEKLDENLILFEKNFKANGGKVIWAATIQEANEAILEICKIHNTKLVVKSKSMVTEEIRLNDFLQKNNIESIETDLGEYIQQLDNEPPYHIVTPAMHKSKEDIAKLFYKKLNTEPNLSPQELTQVARQNLRNNFLEAQVGITGGNFLLADVGGVCLTENEGNARLATAFPKVHIAVIGIEKILASINDVELFWPLLSTYGTGQQLTVYNSVFTGPRNINETDGPEEMYVVLLDNGRTNLFADPKLRESLYCIRCGACLNACPVYKNIGGHTYATTYSGPIGSVITPHLKDYKNYHHLSHASTLCGECTTVCPVKINIHGMLHYNRTLAKKHHTTIKNERWAWRAWHVAMKNRKLLDSATAGMKTMIVNKLFKNSWGRQRGKIQFGQTFKQLYNKQHKQFQDSKK